MFSATVFTGKAISRAHVAGGMEGEENNMKRMDGGEGPIDYIRDGHAIYSHGWAHIKTPIVHDVTVDGVRYSDLKNGLVRVEWDSGRIRYGRRVD